MGREVGGVGGEQRCRVGKPNEHTSATALDHRARRDAGQAVEQQLIAGQCFACPQEHVAGRHGAPMVPQHGHREEQEPASLCRHPVSLVTPLATYCESVTTIIGTWDADTTMRATYNTARWADCLPRTIPGPTGPTPEMERPRRHVSPSGASLAQAPSVHTTALSAPAAAKGGQTAEGTSAAPGRPRPPGAHTVAKGESAR